MDGQPYTVSENATANPNRPVTGSIWQPASALPSPLALTWNATKGSDVSWVPVPFSRAFRVAHGRTHYGTGYYTLHRIMDGIPLSRPLVPWSTNTTPSSEVGALLAQAGTDLVTLATHPSLQRVSGACASLLPNTATQLTRLTLSTRNDTPTPTHGAGSKRHADTHHINDTSKRVPGSGGGAVIRSIRIRAPASQAAALDRVRLVMSWDGRSTPSVNVPLPMLFGAGTLTQGTGAGEAPTVGAYLVQGLLAYIKWVARAPPSSQPPPPPW